jgi:uncharacterized protein YcgI (DUF1989 family)
MTGYGPLHALCFPWRPREEVPVERDSASRNLVVVPAREARAVRVSRGKRVRLVDLEGGQVIDLFAFVADDPSEYASAEHTRVHVNRLFPRVGESFVTNRRRPILLFEDDSSPGAHDMLCAACDPERYRQLGFRGHHASCRENLERVMEDLGSKLIAIPQPINVFMNVRVRGDGSLEWGPAMTRPGDHVVLRALMDVLLVVSACPQDLNEINNFNPTAVAIEVLP